MTIEGVYKKILSIPDKSESELSNIDGEYVLTFGNKPRR